MKLARTSVLLFSLSMAASCSEAQFAVSSPSCVGAGCEVEDPAGKGMRDGGPPPEAPVVPARELLLGKYAIRAQFYGHERATQGVLTHEILLLGEIVHDAERDVLQLDHQVCADRGEVIYAQGPTVSARALYPERLPRRRLDVIHDDTSFHTEGPPVLFGYEAAPPAACRPGRQIPRPEPVPWGGATCTCPLSDVPPTSASDCRVVDADGDGEPGFTVQVSGPVQANTSLRLKDMTQIARGKIDSRRRHTGDFVRAAEEGYLACPDSSCRGTSLSLCPEGLNPVEFAPLDEDKSWTCSDIIREIEAGRLLPVRGLAFPPGC